MTAGARTLTTRPPTRRPTRGARSRTASSLNKLSPQTPTAPANGKQRKRTPHLLRWTRPLWKWCGKVRKDISILIWAVTMKWWCCCCVWFSFLFFLCVEEIFDLLTIFLLFFYLWIPYVFPSFYPSLSPSPMVPLSLSLHVLRACYD